MSIQGGNREAAYVAVDEASHRYPAVCEDFATCHETWKNLKVLLLLTFVKKSLLFEEK